MFPSASHSRFFYSHDTPRYPAPFCILQLYARAWRSTTDDRASTVVITDVGDGHLPVSINSSTRYILPLLVIGVCVLHASHHRLLHCLTPNISLRHNIVPGVFGIYCQAQVPRECDGLRLAWMAHWPIISHLESATRSSLVTRQCTAFTCTFLRITTPLS